MVESSFKPFDPLAYFVNNVDDLSPDVVKAHRNKNSEAIQKLLEQGDPSTYDVFICVNSTWHAFVMCAPANASGNDNLLDPFADMPTDDPFAIPNQLLVWGTELCFEFAEQKMYKIRFKLSMFGDFKAQIKRCFYIGKYKRLTVNGLQLAVLRASPKRYKVLLDDCVEFAKTFCYELLSFCGNGSDIERSVESRLEQATASGLSVEKLSRKVRSSGLLGNSILGTLDMSSFFTATRRGIGAIILGLTLLVLTQIVVSVIVCYIVIKIMME